MPFPTSSGAPRGRALKAIRNVIQTRQVPTTISRPTTTTGNLDQQQTTLTDHTERLWVFDPQSNVTEVAAGERVQGDLNALARDGIDVRKDDRLTHGGVEYEVDTVVGFPEDAEADGTDHDEDTAYFHITLRRRN